LCGVSCRQRRATARASSPWSKTSDPHALEVLDRPYRDIGRAMRIGVTEPAGAGRARSSIQLAASFGFERRARVVAVDPTSLVTGGALLGDRVRLGPGRRSAVFFRSLATRAAPAVYPLHRQSRRRPRTFGCDDVVIRNRRRRAIGARRAEKAHNTVVCCAGIGDGIR
jgi:LAO/AO transport system kinase